MIPEASISHEDPQRLRRQIREDDEARFDQRVARVQRVKVHRIIPQSWFDLASTECRDLFRDGHFYGCICLSQSVAEGLAKFILEVHRVKIGRQRRPIEQCKKPVTGKPLIDMLRKLSGGTRNGRPMNALSDKCLGAFDCIEGGDRDDFHHLNKGIPTQLEKLEKRAEECVTALYEIESELFGFDFASGSLVPPQRQYWPEDGKYVKVYLRAY